MIDKFLGAGAAFDWITPTISLLSTRKADRFLIWGYDMARTMELAQKNNVTLYRWIGHGDNKWTFDVEKGKGPFFAAVLRGHGIVK